MWRKILEARDREPDAGDRWRECQSNVLQITPAVRDWTGWGSGGRVLGQSKYASDDVAWANNTRIKGRCLHSQLLSHAWLFATLWTTVGSSSVHGIRQARILKWVTISSSRRSSWPRDQTHSSCISCIIRQILEHWATKEAQEKDNHEEQSKTCINKTVHCYYSTYLCGNNDNLKFSASRNFRHGNFNCL